MLRAIVVLPIMALVSGLVCVVLFLPGLVYPSSRLFAFMARLWARIALAISGVKLTIEGSRHLSDKSGQFLVGNHQSALDIPILFAASRGQSRFIAKNTLFRIPLFGWVMRLYGHFSVDRSSARRVSASLERMIRRIRTRPVTLTVFPEGTRSTDGRLLPFRHGAMKICQRVGLPVVPFAIHGSLAVHRRGSWRPHPGPVRVVFAPPIPVDKTAALSSKEFSDLVFEEVERCLVQAGGEPARRRTTNAMTEESKPEH